MGRYYLRGSQQEDSSYAEFSTESDSFTWFFPTREECIEHMTEEIRFQHPYWGNDGHMHIPEEIPTFMVSFLKDQLFRLDTYGSTSLMRSGHWGRSIRLMHGVPRRKPKHNWELPRDRVDEHIKAHLDKNYSIANGLLVAVPWEN